jgi:hypothetical protein
MVYVFSPALRCDFKDSRKFLKVNCMLLSKRRQHSYVNNKYCYAVLNSTVNGVFKYLLSCDPIILRRIFRKWEGVVGTGWSGLRIGIGGGHL